MKLYIMGLSSVDMKGVCPLYSTNPNRLFTFPHTVEKHNNKTLDWEKRGGGGNTERA